MVIRLTVLLIAAGCLSADDAAPVPSRAASVARTVAKGGWLSAWVLYPPEAVKPDEELPQGELIDALRISAARGESEPFIFAVRANSSMNHVGPVISDLRNEEGQTIPAAAVSVRRMAYIYVDARSGANGPNRPLFESEAGWHADVLTNDSDGFLRAKRNLPFWVTIAVPRAAAAGVYRGELTLNFRTQDWIRKRIPPIRLPIEVEVYPFQLPSPSPLRNVTVFDLNRLPASWLTPEHTRAMCRLAAQVRSAPDPVMPSLKLTYQKDGTLAVDSAGWEAMAKYCLDELNVPCLFVPVWPRWNHREKKQGPLQGIYYMWHFPHVAKQRWPIASPVFIATEQAGLRPEFKKAFGSYMKHMNEIVRRNGWAGRVFVTSLDEPYTYHATGEARKLDTPENNYRVIAEYCDLVHTVAPDLRTFVTADPVPELVGKIDHWSLRTYRDLKLTRERAAEGDVVTFLDNYRSIIDFPLASSRSFGWLSWKLGASGWINSQSMAGFERSWEGSVFNFPIPNTPIWWGCMMLFYPDPIHTQFLPSVRWEMMREGCDDYEYLWLLDRRVKRLGPNSADAKAGIALLARAQDMADTKAFREPPKSTQQTRANEHSNRTLWELRCQIGELLKRTEP
jgi:hypothetical protein